MTDVDDSPGIELLWIPLGAGGSPVVRLSGRAYEGLAARRERRPRCALVHAALSVRPGGPPVTVEVTPVWGQPAGPRGVVATGPVGAGVLGRSRFFRYEVRCWAGGVIPDAAWAVERSHVAGSATTARALLDAAPASPGTRGDGMPRRWATCGRRTRSSRGCWRGRASTRPGAGRRPGVARPAGPPGRRLHVGDRATAGARAVGSGDLPHPDGLVPVASGVRVVVVPVREPAR